MKISRMIVALVCFVGLTQLVWSQNGKVAAVGNQSHGIPGFLDPQTGTFSTRVQSASESADGEPVTAVTYWGTYVATFTISISSTFPTGTVFDCSTSLSTGDFGSNGSEGSYSEEGSAIATGSGSTRTCKVVIPYSWLLLNGPTDTVNISYSVSAISTGTVGTVTTAVALRTASRSVGSSAMPAVGAITNLTYAPRL
jgi:hypothetical protein